MRNIVIAIDGPAGSGKSTIAKELSSKYGVFYLDTGAMYRAVAYLTIVGKIDFSSEPQMNDLMNKLDLTIKFDGTVQRTLVNGEDVTDKIRTEEVAKVSSDVATLENVRVKLVEIQRDFVMKNGGIVDGRDIGSYVLPDADYKFYITATVKERATRRSLEYKEKGLDISIDDILRTIEKRDAQDMNRKFAPLIKTIDAIEIDTTGIDIKKVIERIIGVVGEKYE